MNKYIENSQQILQNSKPRWPGTFVFDFHDLWSEAKENQDLIDVHNIEKNELKIEVRNVSVNRVIYLDKLKGELEEILRHKPSGHPIGYQ